MEQYINRHRAMGFYEDREGQGYRSRRGWMDYRIGEGIIFSHRVSPYTVENFPEHLHRHEYCELLFWEKGDVEYLCGDRSVRPSEGCVIMIPPHASHTARLRTPCNYDRYVLYFQPTAFRFCGKSTGVGEFCAQMKDGFSIRLSREQKNSVFGALGRIEQMLEGGSSSSELAAYAELTLLLCHIEAYSSKEESISEGELLPDRIREIRDWMDNSYTTISSVDEVAAHFYYSREYVTRLFRRYFNLSPGKYLEQLRIREACARIDGGEKITEVCYAVGYRSMSAFSSAFHRVMGEAPSRYRGHA